ncbi:dihydroorotate dehydrogenase B catalytic subunit [Marispirochaeta aestuarii]|uniref:Dihydroorotate dehydrogenase n=1 Tax=Marispirochaeta aestuarii TaxID=1963862 RepID=A0A1Y1RZW1_9SPIO|nr:dihydroorotate dehydrogenase [Marispirochaeta aestuarii]ORC36483.1 dihydroorotate dehydrogenase B catalytic subunit [Marispirochaeta aestuarii]
MELTVQIGTKKLPNPTGVASGTFGYGSEYEELVDLSSLGAIYSKAVTPEARPGNDIPRIIETPAGLLNSIGLANVGLERFISEKLPLFRRFPCPVVVNVAGKNDEDYCRVVEELDEFDEVWGYEINLSCPNVKEGCLAFGSNPAYVEGLTRKLRGLSPKPMIIKLTPNVTDIASIAKAAEAGGADAVSCINTLVGMVIDIHKKKPVLPAGTGGLSGPAIKPVGVAAVYRVKRAVGIPVIGIGGIQNAEDAIEYLLAGASAVQIGTATFVDPAAPVKVLAGIKAYMKEEGLESLKDFHRYIP